MTAARPAPDLTCYLVTDEDLCASAGRSVLDTVVSAVDGGATCVQLRAKTTDGGPFLDQVVEVARAVGDRVPIIVNDRVDVFLAARALGAPVAGVHVGQSDLPAPVVRRLIGDDAYLGVSVGTDDEALAARREGAADHVGLSVLRSTTTKTDTPDVLGYDGCERLAALAGLPSCAIGGVGAADVAPLAAAGVDGAAIVSAICCAPDPAAACAQVVAAWRQARA
ncbi:thiamine phosphate synthase [Actinomyces sp. B33]|uniref:thiamine phosphate synthase n=1 Tax=Actinomyces sp. B33 TaxID=2942131 RepID=UPI002340B881|nr:thiamine phosphate synthase [Actinomyces sp. B33]MDC4232336.1 thiamine phosphate synthase [Actinomyces sp. B33]